MTTEIELKYLLPATEQESSTIVNTITEMLEVQKKPFIFEKKKINDNYFDNKELILRKLDIGLRIRDKNQEYEETIKTAGKVEGCLHQRPEYNVALEEKQLNLLLFPKNIWPPNLNLTLLQQSLYIIFNISFSRHTWLITQEDSVMELAYDMGSISAPFNNEPLKVHELEIELIKGDKQALYILAEQLKTIIQMEPGKLSKAARGYALYNKRDCHSDN